MLPGGGTTTHTNFASLRLRVKNLPTHSPLFTTHYSFRPARPNSGRGRGNAGLGLDSPWPECYIQDNLKLGMWPKSLKQNRALVPFTVNQNSRK